MLSLEQLREKVGFDIDDFVRQSKANLESDLQKKIRVRLYVDNPSSQAMSRYSGNVLEVHLPARDTIRQQKPELTEPEITAKYKAAFIEELCHGVYHETNHDERVVGCTLGEMRKHMTPEEQQSPYIQEKISKLQMAAQPVVGTPI